MKTLWPARRGKDPSVWEWEESVNKGNFYQINTINIATDPIFKKKIF